MRRWLVLNGVLAVIVLGLIVQVVRTWARTLPPIEVASGGGKGIEMPARGGEGGKKSKRAAAAAEKTAQTPVTLVTAIINKDLFDPTRQKATEETKVTAAAHEPPPTGITLTGVRIFGKDREGFIIDAGQANSQRRIRIGDPVGNYTVKEIRTSYVLITSQAGDEVKLTLELDKSKTGAPTGPTTTPRRPLAPGAAAAAAAGANASPAAGVVSGQPTAAGVGAAPHAGTPPTGAAATPAPLPPGVGAQTPAPPAPGRGSQPQIPQLPAGVRSKIEQMKKDRGK
jgi:hypothetical protein